MLGFNKSRDHLTNEILFQRLNQVPSREMLSERHLKFTGHCIRMPTDELINMFDFYESKVRPSLRPGAPTKSYRLQISSHLLHGEKALDHDTILKKVFNLKKG